MSKEDYPGSKGGIWHSINELPPTDEGRILIMQILKKNERTSPTLATYGNYHFTAQQYTLHLSLLFAILLHDQH